MLVRAPGFLKTNQGLGDLIPAPWGLRPNQVYAAEPAIHTAAERNPVSFALQHFLARIGNGVFVLVDFDDRRIRPAGKSIEAQIDRSVTPGRVFVLARFEIDFLALTPASSYRMQDL